MEYTETTSTSWFSRLGSSFGGVLIGVLLLVGGTVLLWWNEGDFVKTRDAINEAWKVAVELPQVGHIDPSFDGKLVHAVALADTKEILHDPVFGVGNRAIALKRNVEFYQWVEDSRTETKQKLGGGEEQVTTYTYNAKWVSRPVDSQRFHAPYARTQHVNRVLLNIDDQEIQAKHVSFGAYHLPNFLISAIGGAQPFQPNLTPAVYDKITLDILRAQPQIGATYGNSYGTNSWQGFPSQGQMPNYAQLPRSQWPRVVHEQGSVLYLGANPSTPAIGDMRITFELTPSATVSVLARVKSNSFEPFHASNGKEVSGLSMGQVSMEAMFASKHSGNETMTWVFRLLGTVLVMSGFGLLLNPLKVIASVIPFLGSIVGVGTGLVSFLLGLAWSLIVISIAWLRFRPVTGAIMVGVAVVLLILLHVKGRNQQAAA